MSKDDWPKCPDCQSKMICPECGGAKHGLHKTFVDQAMATWNTRAHSALPRLHKITAQRKRHLKARMNDEGGPAAYLTWLAKLIDLVNATPFLLGDNDQGWTCSWDWLHKNEANPCKVFEGVYHHIKPPPPGRQAHTTSVYDGPTNAPRSPQAEAEYQKRCQLADQRRVREAKRRKANKTGGSHEDC